MVDIDLIKSNIVLSQLVSQQVSLRRTSNKDRWVGLCPFHQEKNPSFCVDDSWGRYKCYSCNAKGDCITYLQGIMGVSFSEALKQAAVIAGVSTDFMTPSQREVYEARSKRLAVERKAVRAWKKELRENLVIYTNAQWKIYRVACRQLMETFTEELESQAMLAYTEATRREAAMDQLDEINDKELAEYFRTRKSWEGLKNPAWCLKGHRLEMVSRIKGASV